MALLAAVMAGHVQAQTVASAAALADLSLEELAALPVTSVTGRAESLRGAAASIFVITGDDIRRSTATSLPEALRLAPNLQVARASGGGYAITARGFNDVIANKLLVLVDGRTIYSPLFSGTYWDFHDVPLQDIERIEVISGPGGTLWGANAVNGIINVITRPASATQGALVSATRSSRQGGREVLQWGGRLGEAGHFRVYGMGIDRNNTVMASGAERPDAASRVQAGFRADLRLGSGDLTVQGDSLRGGDDPGSQLAPKLHGGNLLARWESRFPDGSPYRVQAYWDLVARDEVTAIRNHVESWDVQFTHEPAMPAGQKLLWGGGLRSAKDRDDPSALVLMVPAERRLGWANVFAQHQLAVAPGWELTTGAKAERNDYTGLEFLPSVRLAWTRDESTTWGALSRTVRAPSRVDRDFYFPGRAPFLIAGGPNFQSEVATVLEFGHRGTWGRGLSYSATVFRQHYAGLRAGRGFPAQVENRIHGNATGLETWAQWQATPDWRLSAGLLAQRQRLAFNDGPGDTQSIPNLGNDPNTQWNVRSQWNLGSRTELDLHVRRVGRLTAPRIPSYTSVDLRLGWRATPALELSLLAQNLLNDRHTEFGAANAASEFGRMVWLRATWQP